MSAHVPIHIFFFNDTATTEIYTLSLHDALPIYNSANTGTPVQQPHFDDERTVQSAQPVVPLEQINAKVRSEEHTSELQSQSNLVCRLLLEKKKKQKYN